MVNFMKRGKLLLLFYGIVFAVLQVQANTEITFNPFKAEFNEISPGIWTSIRNNPHLHPVMGNSVFIIGEKGVVIIADTLAFNVRG